MGRGAASLSCGDVGCVRWICSRETSSLAEASCASTATISRCTCAASASNDACSSLLAWLSSAGHCGRDAPAPCTLPDAPPGAPSTSTVPGGLSDGVRAATPPLLATATGPAPQGWVVGEAAGADVDAAEGAPRPPLATAGGVEEGTCTGEAPSAAAAGDSSRSGDRALCARMKAAASNSGGIVHLSGSSPSCTSDRYAKARA